MFEIAILLLVILAFLVPVLIKELWPVICPFVLGCVFLVAPPLAWVAFCIVSIATAELLDSLVEACVHTFSATSLEGYKGISVVMYTLCSASLCGFCFAVLASVCAPKRQQGL